MAVSYIYALCEPETKEVRYVGKSINPKERYRNHLKDKNKSYRASWIKNLKNRGLKPMMVILEEVEVDQANESETWWIGYLKKLGYELTNSTSGGDGLNGMTDELKMKLRMAKLGKPSKIRGTKRSQEAIENNRRAQQKLTDEQVIEIRRLLSECPEYDFFDLASIYSVSPATINNIVRGRTYKHISCVDGKTSEIRAMRGKRNVLKRPNTMRINAIRKIREMSSDGISVSAIAKDMNTGYQTIWNIVNGKTYNWIK